MQGVLFNPVLWQISAQGNKMMVAPEVKVLDCCADWMCVLQICSREILAAVSNQVYNERAVPAGKCRRRLAYG